MKNKHIFAFKSKFLHYEKEYMYSEMQAGGLSEGSISSTSTRSETNKIHKNWIQSSVER